MHGHFLTKLLAVVLLSATAASAQGRPGGEIGALKCWSYTADATASPLQIAAAGTRLYIAFDDASIDALATDGKKLWSSELGGEIASNLLPRENGLLVVTASAAASGPREYKLRVLSLETGIPSSAMTLPVADRSYLMPAPDGQVLIAAGGSILSVNTARNAIGWKREVAQGFSADPAQSEEKVALATTSQQVFVLSSRTGEIGSMRKMPFNVTSLAWTVDGTLAAGDERGNISLLGSEEKPLWRFRAGGQVARLREVNGTILAASYDNFVYSISVGSGDVVWKRRLPGRVSHLALLGRLYVAVSSNDESGAMIIDLSNGKTAGQLPIGEDEPLLAAAAAGETIFVATTRGAYAFAASGCPDINKGGPPPSAAKNRP